MSATTSGRMISVAPIVLDFFTERSLTRQIGVPSRAWGFALLKEVIDNALDACEGAGVTPEIALTTTNDHFIVADNGPGLPLPVIDAACDYSVRVSDKAPYPSPTRGQIGNALKTLFAAAFVGSGGTSGAVVIETDGQRHEISVALNRIEGHPRVTRCSTASDVRNGTRITVPLACSLPATDADDFYIAASSLLVSYIACNPHGSFSVERAGKPPLGWQGDAAWHKWVAAEPTPATWFTLDRMRDLIAAYLRDESRRGMTIREFIASFAGLKATAKQREIAAAAGLTGTTLDRLRRGDDLDTDAISALWLAMLRYTNPVKPRALGVLGNAYLVRHFTLWHAVTEESVRYKKVEGNAGSLPFVLEICFGVMEMDDAERDITVALNFSPSLFNPVDELDDALADARVDEDDPVAVFVHLTCPILTFRDPGKTMLALPAEIASALREAVASVTKPWREAKRHADRDHRMRQRDLERQRRGEKRGNMDIKEAVYAVLPDAYRHASGDGTLPVLARGLMYAVRPLVLPLTGGRLWSDTDYFTQTLLPDYIREHPDETTDWDVIYDDRGTFHEPHTDIAIGLGTAAVREYHADWIRHAPAVEHVIVPHRYPTHGPANRFGAVLFVEKETFVPVFTAARLAERFDIAVMSTKGFASVAGRTLVDTASVAGTPIFCIRDCDKAGFGIAHTLKEDTRRYEWSAPPNVIDLGLRLDEAQAMGLMSEQVTYRAGVDPRVLLWEQGATEEECQFLVQSGTPQTGWRGERIELNAMTSPQLIAWLEQKLAAHGVEKVVPDDDILEDAFRRAARAAHIQHAVDDAESSWTDEGLAIPPNLGAAIRKRIAGTDVPWDDAVRELAQTADPSGKGEESGAG